MIVLDCLIVASSCLPDEDSSAADLILQSLEENAQKAVVPGFFWLEFANVLLIALRGKRLSSQMFKERWEDWQHMPLETDTKASVEDILSFAHRYHLTTYDATYLELAVRLKLPLATLDKKLRAAALKEKVAFQL